MKYIYWLNNENGGIGAWSARKKALIALEEIKKITKKNWKVEKIPAKSCPKCGKLERKDIINSFNMCLECEKYN